MKKILLKTTIFITTLFIFCSNLLAYTSTLVPSKTTVFPGQTFTIKINLSSVPSNGLGAATYVLGFDNSLFEVTNISTSATYNKLTSQVKFAFLDTSGGNNPLKNGTFATITFKAKSISSDKTGTFNLTSSGISDSNANPVSNTNKGTSVKVHIPSTDNNLKNLTINGTTITGFNTNTTSYTYKTESSSIKIAAVASHSAATISGTGTKTVNYGTNTYNIVVKAENGSSKTYKITVTRPDNREKINTLESLEVKDYTITPTFNKNTLNYSLNVESNIDKVTLNATKTSTKSSFVNGFGPREVTLNYGQNKVYIKVKAENQSINTYTITINRKDNRSSNNNLKTLTPSLGKINFKEDILEYSIVTDKDEISFTAETQDSKSKLEGNKTYKLKNGLNKIEVIVTAENQTKKTYTINVTKVEDISLLNISNSLNTLNIFKKYNVDFNKDKTEYNITIGDETSLELDYKLIDDYSTVEVLGNENLKDGSVITLKLSAINGEIKEYKINIVKEKIEEPVEEKKTGNIILIILLVISVILNIVLLITKNKKNKTEMTQKETKEENVEEVSKETQQEENHEETISEPVKEEIQEIPDEIITEEEKSDE